MIGCSALKRAYRDILVHGRSDVRIVYLKGTQQLIASRLARRKGHFMSASCSRASSNPQPPGGDEHPVTASIDASADDIVDDILHQLKLKPAASDVSRRNRP